MIGLSGPPGHGWPLLVIIVGILLGIALLGEVLGRREMRRRNGPRS